MIGRFLLVALLAAGSACASIGPSTAGPSPAGPWPRESRGRLTVANDGMRGVRVYAVSERGGEIYLGMVRALATREFAVAPSSLGDFRLVTRPIVEAYALDRHTSELISVPEGWDVAWSLRSSPLAAMSRISTFTISYCAAARC